MRHNMTRVTAGAFLSLIGSVAIAAAQSAVPSGGSSAAAPAANLSKADRGFAAKAARSGLAEVADAQLALQKSDNQEVKSFAQRMVDDHTKANNQLAAIAGQDGLKLPTKPSRADDRKTAALQKLSGTAFDKRYIRVEVADHKAAVSLFTTESKDGQDPSLKNFATQTLPTLQDHYRMAQDLAAGKPMNTSPSQ